MPYKEIARISINHFRISINRFMDIQYSSYLRISKNEFWISKTQVVFMDIHFWISKNDLWISKMIYGYPKLIYGYPNIYYGYP